LVKLQEAAARDVEKTDSSDNLILVQRQPRRASSATTLLVFLLAILVMCMGIIGGILFYRQYLRENYHRQWRGICGFPYDGNDMDNDVWSYNKRLQVDDSATNLLQ
jgi:hypothetical protein